MYTEDTIAAIATPPGIGGVGIIRVSGRDCFAVVDGIFKSKGQVPLGERANRTIQYGHIIDDEGQIIDEVLLLLMKGPHSYTTEDVIEIQCHGGLVPVRKILSLLLTKQVRLAEPGEFTKRAFLNGRIDLTQAEAIVDIIDAKTEESLRLAMQQLDGTLTSLIRNLRENLLQLIAHLEVTIDYPEEDIEELTLREVTQKLEPIMVEMDEVLATAQTGRLVRDGILTAIVGLPNAGKSSLLNALLRENRAIVTEIAGTTRDSIEEYMNIEGIALRLVDTAGIRETEDIVEQMGVSKAKEYLEQADLVLAVIDASKPLVDEEKEILQAISHRKSIVFLNKEDLGVAITPAEVSKYGSFTAIASISAAQGEGLSVLAKEVKELVYGGAVQTNHQAVLSNVRHITLMERAKEQLGQALETIACGMPVDCVVTDLRGAWEVLGEINGDSLRESMVDELFKRFCLGK